MKKLIVVWLEFYEGGKAVDNYFDLPATMSDAQRLVHDCKRFPFMYQIAEGGLPVVNWTMVTCKDELPFVAEGNKKMETVRYTREQAIEIVDAALKNLGVTQPYEILPIDEDTLYIFSEEVENGEIPQLVDVKLGPIEANFYVPDEETVRFDYHELFDAPAPLDMPLENLIQSIFLWYVSDYVNQVVTAVKTVIEFNNEYTEKMLGPLDEDSEHELVMRMIADKMLGPGFWFNYSLGFTNLGEI